MFKDLNSLISNLTNLVLLCNFSCICILHNFPVVCNIHGDLILSNCMLSKMEYGNVVYADELSVCLHPRETLIEVLSVPFGFRTKDPGFGQFVGRKNLMI